MVPKVVQDAGYTAVGLGVMAVQQIQVRRRAIRSAVAPRLQCLQAQAGSALDAARTVGGPLVSQLARLTRTADEDASGVGPTGRD